MSFPERNTLSNLLSFFHYLPVTSELFGEWGETSCKAECYRREKSVLSDDIIDDILHKPYDLKKKNQNQNYKFYQNTFYLLLQTEHRPNRLAYVYLLMQDWFYLAFFYLFLCSWVREPGYFHTGTYGMATKQPLVSNFSFKWFVLECQWNLTTFSGKSNDMKA